MPRPAAHSDGQGRREVLGTALRVLAPRLPGFETEAVIDHALVSPGLRGASAPAAAWLALVAYARHTFTEYDALLAEGYDRDSARHFVVDDLNDTLAGWGVRRRVDTDPDDGGGADASGVV